MFSDCRTLKDAKSKWRKLAKLHHPDHGGTAKEFLAARKDYEDFKARFKSDVACKFCDGQGKLCQSSGFSTLYTTCHHCSGSGKAKRG